MSRLFTRKTVIRIVFALAGLLAGISATVADDSLLSEVRIDSVYESSKGSSGTAGRIPVRVLSLKQLSGLLSDATFEIASTENDVVKTTKRLNPWLFPVYVGISDDERSIEITLGLSSLAKGEKVKAETLLGMLEINRKHAPTQFLFNESNRRTELFSSIDNEDITQQALRDEINRLAALAKDNESVWKIGEQKQASETTKEPEKTPGKTSTPESTDKPTDKPLTGTWSASRSAQEAFAIRFAADGSFVLVYIKDGKQTRSEGNFTQEGSALVLEGKTGFKLTGSFQRDSDEQFRFEYRKAATLTFKRASK